MIDNPFFHRGPIRNPAYFYNRTTEVRQILKSLARGQSVSLTGSRKIGKTSLLFNLCRPEGMAQHGLDPARHLLVYFNCEGLESLGYEAFLALILDEIVHSLDRQDPGFEVPEGPISFREFRDAIRDITESGLKVTLLMDEFEFLDSNPPLCRSLFPGLRALATESLLVYVTVSRQELVECSIEYSPFFNVFVHLNLGLFGEQQSRALIEHSLAQAGAAFPAEILDLILAWGGRHPFFLQVVGYWALELQVTKGAPLQSKDLDILRQTVHAQVEPHFSYYWEHLSPEEQYVLAALPVAQMQETYRQQLVSLASLCLIVKTGEQYDYFSPLFRDFVRLQKVPDVLQEGPLALVRPLQLVLLDERELPLNARQFSLLSYLMERSNRVVSNEELDREVLTSPDEREDYQYLSDSRLKSAIRDLRRGMEDHASWIVNRPGVGYMLQIERQE